MFSDAQKALVVAKNAVKKALKSAKLNKRVAVKAEHNALVVYAKIAKANVKKAQEEAKRAEKKVTIAKVGKNKAEKKLKTLRATLLKDTTQEQLNVSVKKIEIAYKALNVAKTTLKKALDLASRKQRIAMNAVSKSLMANAKAANAPALSSISMP